MNTLGIVNFSHLEVRRVKKRPNPRKITATPNDRATRTL